MSKLTVLLKKLKGWSGWLRLKQVFNFKHLLGDKIDYRNLSGTLKKVNWKSPRVAGGIAAAAIGIIAVGIFLASATSAYEIVSKGQRLAVVKSRDEAKRIVDAVLTEKGKPAGQVAFTKEPITYESVRVKEVQLDSERSATKVLEEQLDVYVKGYVVKVNGNGLFTLASKADADGILQKVKDKYAKPSEQISYESVEFDEKVEVVESDVKPAQVDPSDLALESLAKGKVNTVSYQIQAGDNLWTIARKNDMYIKDLLDGNPGLTPQTVLKIGQKLDIVKITPFVNVVAKGSQNREEVIPFGTVYKLDGNLGPGQSKTVTAGTDGAKQVSFKFTSRNGSVIEKVILSEKVKQNPISQVVARGPAAPRINVAASRGSGSASGFAWPLRGPITSGFGIRWGRMHTGIDIDGNTGDVFYSSLDGTVLSTEWQGGYGKRILIDHGNGVQTLYGHASGYLVSPGQKVTKGQPIGLVGATGNATGSVLHFEIIINGSKVNPLGYL